MTPESALEGVALHERALRPQSASGSPERFLGRLVNLREQLTDEEFGQLISMNAQEWYAAIIDDLDDIIKCVTRGIENVEYMTFCDRCQEYTPRALEPDSEDMEAR